MKSLRSDRADIENLSGAPRAPGVYLFLDSQGIVLYVGKAKDLRQRLSCYVKPPDRLPAKTRLMVRRAMSFSYMVTSTETEAFILEATLIKEHRPRYNVLLRDDKAYPFIRLEITGVFPRLRVVRRRRRDGALYFGPYPSAGAVKETLRLLSSAFGLRTCSDAVLRGRSRECLKYQIGRCSAPCTGKISPAEYGGRVEQVRLFLEGRTGSLLHELRRRMADAAEALEYELAAILRDRIAAVEAVTEAQSMVASTGADWDVLGLARHGERAVVALIRVREGVVLGQEVHHLSRVEDETDEALLSIFLQQHYRDGLPAREIVVPFLPDDFDAVSAWLAGSAATAVSIRLAKRGARRRLAEMALENARQFVAGLLARAAWWDELAERMAAVLGLTQPPETVEGVDISCTGGAFSVGSVVAFRRGESMKDGYRHYNVRGVQGPDDPGMIREVVTRRFGTEPENAALPDVLLIDGGPGQLGRALEAVAGLGISGRVELVALAKERGDEGEKIYRPGWPRPLFLPRHDPVLLFLQQVRDEAHRFGVRFHRTKRDRGRLRSGLAAVPGVGPERERVLLTRFGSAAGLERASLDDLLGVHGIPASVARAVHDHFRRKGQGPAPGRE